MLECEGYKMFKGSALISSPNGRFEPFTVSGVWLYKPEFETWYCGGRSYPAEIVTVMESETDG